MNPMASQITSLGIVYCTAISGSDQRKHQSSASLAFVRRIHRGPVNSPHKRPVTRKMFSFDDVIMISSQQNFRGTVHTLLTMFGRRTMHTRRADLIMQPTLRLDDISNQANWFEHGGRFWRKQKHVRHDLNSNTFGSRHSVVSNIFLRVSSLNWSLRFNCAPIPILWRLTFWSHGITITNTILC